MVSKNRQRETIDPDQIPPPCVQEKRRVSPANAFHNVAIVKQKDWNSTGFEKGIY